MESAFGSSIEEMKKLTKEEAAKILPKVFHFGIKEKEKFNNSLNFLSVEFGKMLNNIIKPSFDVVDIFDELEEIKVSVGKKGNLKCSLLIDGEREIHSTKDAKNLDNKQKAIDEYIDEVKNALEKHPIIQAIKESKAEDKGDSKKPSNPGTATAASPKA